MKKIVILVAAHKKYRMPTDPIYLPVQVGAEGEPDLGYTRDDTGDNISFKNANYCELTGLYWLWKNVTADYVGLVHYRRHFVSGRGRDKWARVAGRDEIVKLLKTTNVILPRKRNYFIDTIYNQHAHAHHAVDLDTTREILVEKYPSYVSTFDKCMRRTYGHKFNMFVMRKDIADAYCQWLFDVLFELEKRLDISKYSEYDARVFGFVSECLLDVWIETNKIPYQEMPVAFMEKQNWIIKGANFLSRKFGFRSTNGDNKWEKTGLQSALKNSQINNNKMTILDDIDIQMVQKVLLQMLDDILDVCNRYHIKYQMSGGSALGAIRHHGFIPWDDDIDINMPRSEIGRFINEFKRLYGDKYWIYVPGQTKDYDYMMIHIMKKDIRARTLMDSNKDGCGLCIDIFIVENTFNNGFLRRIHGYGCMIFRYALSCIRFRRNEEELNKLLAEDADLNKYLKVRCSIGRILLLIPLSWWTKASDRWARMCKDNSSKYVVITAGTNQFFSELYLRKKFDDSIVVKFEGRDVYVTADYDAYLTKLYDNYMDIPPEEKREKHAMLELDRSALSKEIEEMGNTYISK